MRRTIASITSLPLLLIGLTATATTASADETWIQGQCYNLTDEQLDAKVLPSAEPVSCNEPHNIEIVATGAADVRTKKKVRRALKRFCPSSATYEYTGDPYPLVGKTHWVTPQRDRIICGITPVSYDRGDMTLLSTSLPIKELMSSSDWVDYGYCFSDLDPWTSAPCAGTGQIPWRMFEVVNLKKRFPDGRYPGQKKLRKIAERKCSNIPDYWYATWPLKKEWKRGVDLLLCYRTIGP